MLTITAIPERLIDVVPTFNFGVIAWPMRFFLLECLITKILVKAQRLFGNVHGVKKLITPASRSETSNPVPFLGHAPDHRFAARQGTPPPKWIRRESPILGHNVGVQLRHDAFVRLCNQRAATARA